MTEACTLVLISSHGWVLIDLAELGWLGDFRIGSGGLHVSYVGSLGHGILLTDKTSLTRLTGTCHFFLCPRLEPILLLLPYFIGLSKWQVLDKVVESKKDKLKRLGREGRIPDKEHKQH